MVTAPATLDDYPANVPPFPVPPRELSRDEAQANFDHYMAVKGQRWQVIRKLLRDDALTPAMTDTKIQELDDWYQNAVTIAPDSEKTFSHRGFEWQSHRMESVWYCIGEDLGLMLGDTVIYRFPHLEWSLCTFGGRRFVNRHRLVVTGHTRPPFNGHCVPYLNLVVSHGHASATAVKQPARFVELMNSAAERA